MTHDYRAIEAENLEWTKRGTKWTPSRLVRVQTPTCRCQIRDTRGFQQITLHVNDPNFEVFVEKMEAIARHFCAGPDVSWCPCIDQWREMRLNAFDKTLYFTKDTEVVDNPLAFEACACILEVSGVWQTRAADSDETRMGMRWQVVQVKEQTVEAPRSLEIDSD